MFISDTTLRDVKARRIQVIVDAKFETLTIQNFLKYEGATAQMAGSSNNVLFPAGTEIIGEITAVQLSQGAILVD